MASRKNVQILSDPYGKVRYDRRAMNQAVTVSTPLSVIICTRNRSLILDEACRATLAVEPPDRSWELLIVDNGSTDDSLEIAQRLAAEFPDRVRVIVEPELGLSAARNAGIHHSRGEILIFVDDDAYPYPGWLRAIEAAFDDESVDCVGGPIDPRLDGELPDWFDDRYLPYLSAWDLGEETVELAYNEYPRGTNVAFRRTALEQFGEFRKDLGRRGKSLRSCEETELCLRIERGGGRILYVPEARVEHLVAASRLSQDWLASRFAAQGESEAIIDWAHAGLAGLRRGHRKFRNNARRVIEDPGVDAELISRCENEAWKAYLRQALLCPLRIPRWRPNPDAGEIRPWLPFV